MIVGGYITYGLAYGTMAHLVLMVLGRDPNEILLNGSIKAWLAKSL